jgi:hypothetical protein
VRSSPFIKGNIGGRRRKTASIEATSARGPRGKTASTEGKDGRKAASTREAGGEEECGDRRHEQRMGEVGRRRGRNASAGVNGSGEAASTGKVDVDQRVRAAEAVTGDSWGSAAEPKSIPVGLDILGKFNGPDPYIYH